MRAERMRHFSLIFGTSVKLHLVHSVSARTYMRLRAAAQRSETVQSLTIGITITGRGKDAPRGKGGGGGGHKIRVWSAQGDAWCFSLSSFISFLCFSRISASSSFRDIVSPPALRALEDLGEHIAHRVRFLLYGFCPHAYRSGPWRIP